jgi:hypothetical protein
VLADSDASNTLLTTATLLLVSKRCMVTLGGRKEEVCNLQPWPAALGLGGEASGRELDTAQHGLALVK